jgi:hypothetical protein
MFLWSILSGALLAGYTVICHADIMLPLDPVTVFALYSLFNICVMLVLYPFLVLVDKIVRAFS